MKSTALPLVLVFMIAGIAPAGDEKDLNGTWLNVEATSGGEKLPEDVVKKTKIVFADGKYRATFGTEDADEGTYKVDRSKKPHAIDMYTKSLKGQAMVGIYELDGDTLRICWNLAGNDRPKDFTSTNKNFQGVSVYKRQK